MSRNIQVGVAVAAAIVVVGLFFMYNDPLSVLQSAPLTDAGDTHGLVVQDQVVGTGAEAVAGSLITVHYTGKLENGTVFDTSVGKTPLEFPLGAGLVIPGFDQGVLGMREGGKRLLIIPPSLGYGAQDYGPIPGNSTLLFEVELVKVTPAQ